MEFFIPTAGSGEHADSVYTYIKEYFEKRMDVVFSDLRILSLNYVHNGKKCLSEVGKQLIATAAGIDEIVIAIFFDPTRSVYCVCTSSCGVVNGLPVLVGPGEAKSATYFEKLSD